MSGISPVEKAIGIVMHYNGGSFEKPKSESNKTNFRPTFQGLIDRPTGVGGFWNSDEEKDRFIDWLKTSDWGEYKKGGS